MGLRHAIPRSFQGFLSPSTRLVTARWVFVGDLYVLRKDAWQGDGQFGYVDEVAQAQGKNGSFGNGCGFGQLAAASRL